MIGRIFISSFVILTMGFSQTVLSAVSGESLSAEHPKVALVLSGGGGRGNQGTRRIGRESGYCHRNQHGRDGGRRLCLRLFG